MSQGFPVPNFKALSDPNKQQAVKVKVSKGSSLRLEEFKVEKVWCWKSLMMEKLKVGKVKSKKSLRLEKCNVIKV